MTKKLPQKPDWILVSSIIVQLTIGSVFIYLHISHSSEPSYLLWRYLISLFSSLVCAGIFLYYIPIGNIKKVSYWLVGIAFTLIAATLIPGIGLEVNGTSRWINIGYSTYYITALATLFLIIGTSRFLADHYDQNKICSVHSAKIFVALFVLVLLMLNQPDVVSFCLLVTLLIALCFIAKLYKQSLLIALVTFIPLLGVIVSEPYRWERFFAFLEPFDHQFDLSWQLANNLLVIGSGNLTGQEYGQGTLSVSSNWSSFVFVTIVEKMGFLGAFIVIVCSLLILWRSFRIAQNCLRLQQLFEGFLVIGITSWIALLSIIHLASSTGLIPTVSVSYPFLSYGKGYLFATTLAYALILRIGMTITAPNNNMDTSKNINVQPLIFLLTDCFLVLGYYTFHLAILDHDLDQRYQNRVIAIQKIKKEQQKKNNILIESSSSKIKSDERIYPQQKEKITDRYKTVLAKDIPK